MRTACAHPLAEPVTLVTGETVAAVCTTCLDRLPAEWLVCQAKGEHDPSVEITALGSPVLQHMCGQCHGIYQEAM